MLIVLELWEGMRVYPREQRFLCNNSAQWPLQQQNRFRSHHVSLLFPQQNVTRYADALQREPGYPLVSASSLRQI